MMRWKRSAALGAALTMMMCAWAQSNPTIREIKVEGNVRLAAADVIGPMRLKVGGPFNAAEVASEEDLILALGVFREVAITSQPAGEGQVDVIVNIVENPLVKEFRVIGNTEISTDEITAIATEIQPLGQLYNLRNGRAIADRVTALYEARGYRIQIEQVGPDRDVEETLTISVLEPKLGEVRIVNESPGNLRTQQSVFERILGRPERGSALNEREFRKGIEDLFATRWFDNIVPRLDNGSVPGEYDVTLIVKERPTGLFNAGVALDPQSRLVGQVSYSDTNFRGSGQNVGLVLSQATVGGGASVDLAWGNEYLSRRGAGINANVYSRVVYNFTGSGSNPFGGNSGQGFDERRTGLDLIYTTPMGKDLLAQVGLNAENIKSLNLDTTNTGSQDARSVQQDGDLVILKLGLSMDQRFPRLDPYEGRLASITLEPGFSNITKIAGQVTGLEDILGKNSFIRTQLEYRQYWPMGRIANQNRIDAPVDQMVPSIALRSRYGFISGRVPFFEQLFIGGSSSLRGYENQQFWGSRSFLTTVEYRRPLQRNFSLVGFADYGGAWGGYGEVTGFPQFSTANLKLAYGLGLAFTTPLGPIRLDYAINQDGGSRVHFNIGTGF